MSSPAIDDHPEAPLFSDGLGERVVAADGATGELLQILRLRTALTAVPSFEFALRERVARLANFRHGYYARVRRVDRGMGPASSLAIVSDHLEGTRLSDILRVAHERQLELDINAALCLIRQLAPAVAVLHENARDVAHGLIAPERLLVAPNGRLVIVEHVLGAAIEQLQYGRDRLWQEFRVAMPPSAGLPRFDHRADVTGLGLVALALILGRPLAADEYPLRIPALLESARERSALGDERPLSAPLRAWLARTLQLDVRRAFASAPEAAAALEELASDDTMYVAAPVALETFLSRYIASLLEPPLQAPPQPAAAIAVAAAPVPAAAPAVAVAVAAPVPAAVPSHQPAHQELPADLAYLAPAPAVPAPVAAVTPAASMANAILAGVDDFLEEEEEEETANEAHETSHEASHADAPRTLFNPEAPFTAQPVQARSAPRGSRRRMGLAIAVAVVVALATAGFAGFKAYGRSSAAPALGALNVQSNPAEVPVYVDGIARGRTPVRLTLAAGAHILELRGSGVPRVIPLNVGAGAEVSQYLEFAEVPLTGQLAVQSDPAGATVVVDGVVRGVAPLTVSDLSPGDHQVELRSEGASARHTVTVQAGGTASLLAPLGAAPGGPVSGWVAVKAPFTLEIREQGRLLGNTDTDRIMMASGRHELELVSDAIGYRSTRVVTVAPGKVSSLALDLPQGAVNLNASPWAEVWIDGQRVGETPIGNLAVPIGPHEIVFKHPQFGEKRHAISVTQGAPVRLSVSMK